jgi:hypothetical protein
VALSSNPLVHRQSPSLRPDASAPWFPAPAVAGALETDAGVILPQPARIRPLSDLFRLDALPVRREPPAPDEAAHVRAEIAALPRETLAALLERSCLAAGVADPSALEARCHAMAFATLQVPALDGFAARCAALVHPDPARQPQSLADTLHALHASLTELALFRLRDAAAPDRRAQAQAQAGAEARLEVEVEAEEEEPEHEQEDEDERVRVWESAADDAAAVAESILSALPRARNYLNRS